jgi:hypothetical protein
MERLYRRSLQGREDARALIEEAIHRWHRWRRSASGVVPGYACTLRGALARRAADLAGESWKLAEEVWRAVAITEAGSVIAAEDAYRWANLAEGYSDVDLRVAAREAAKRALELDPADFWVRSQRLLTEANYGDIESSRRLIGELVEGEHEYRDWARKVELWIHLSYLSDPDVLAEADAIAGDLETEAWFSYAYALAVIRERGPAHSQDRLKALRRSLAGDQRQLARRAIVMSLLGSTDRAQELLEDGRATGNLTVSDHRDAIWVVALLAGRPDEAAKLAETSILAQLAPGGVRETLLLLLPALRRVAELGGQRQAIDQIAELCAARLDALEREPRPWTEDLVPRGDGAWERAALTLARRRAGLEVDAADMASTRELLLQELPKSVVDRIADST